MRLSSFNLAAMVFVLAIGVALGASIFRNAPLTIAAADAQPPSVTPSQSPARQVSERESGAASARQAVGERYVAVIFARQAADIVAHSEGVLEGVYVNLGDRLNAGDVIARTESYSLAQQLEIAEATLRSTQADQVEAEVDVNDAESRYARRQELAESGLISKEDLATAKAQVNKAQAKLQASQARVAEQMARINDTKQSLNNTVVTASFAGTVAARYLDPGATVRSGTPIIGLIRPEDLWIRFAVPEAQHPRVGIGVSVSFRTEDLTVAIPGTVEYVSPATTAMSQELLVEARLKPVASLREQIRPGGSGIVSLQQR